MSERAKHDDVGSDTLKGLSTYEEHEEQEDLDVGDGCATAEDWLADAKLAEALRSVTGAYSIERMLNDSGVCVM